VNQNIWHVRRRLEATQDRSGPSPPSGDHGQQTAPGSDLCGTGAVQFLRRQDHDDAGDCWVVRQGPHRTLQYAATGEILELFGKRAAEAARSAGGDYHPREIRLVLAIHPALDLHQLRLFVLTEFVDRARLLVGHFLDLVQETMGVILGDAALLFELLDLLVGVTPYLPDGGL
jgi:hypothetical protein